jgi:hypothetical protein
MEKTFVVKGWVRHDPFGRIVIDECPSDQAHLVHAATDPETNKPGCRYLLEEFFDRATNAPMLDRKGTLRVYFCFEPDETAGTIEDALRDYMEDPGGNA